MKEKVNIDLGASGTRFCQKKGIIDTIPNNMLFLDKNTYVDLVPYDGNLSEALEVIITKNGDTENAIHALIGSLAERYSAGNERPSVSSNKLSQRINFVSAIASIAYMKVKYQMQDNIEMYLALPPIEVKTGKAVAENIFVGEYDVIFPKFNYGSQVRFKIEHVNCYEESFLAMMAYLFNTDGTIREDNKQCKDGYTLSVDIGASTSDLAAMKDGRYLELTGKTYKTGGNVARDYLMDSIRGEFGYDLPVDEAEKAMMEGRIRVGNTYKIITEYVESAKAHLARELGEQMKSYFRQVEIPIQLISNIVVSGGGSLESFYLDENDQRVITSRPTSVFLTDILCQICPEVSIHYYGDGARLANINGLFIKSSVDSIIEQKREAAQRNGMAANMTNGGVSGAVTPGMAPTSAVGNAPVGGVHIGSAPMGINQAVGGNLGGMNNFAGAMGNEFNGVGVANAAGGVKGAGGVNGAGMSGVNTVVGTEHVNMAAQTVEAPVNNGGVTAQNPMNGMGGVNMMNGNSNVGVVGNAPMMFNQ